MRRKEPNVKCAQTDAMKEAKRGKTFPTHSTKLSFRSTTVNRDGSQQLPHNSQPTTQKLQPTQGGSRLVGDAVYIGLKTEKGKHNLLEEWQKQTIGMTLIAKSQRRNGSREQTSEKGNSKKYRLPPTIRFPLCTRRPYLT